MQKFCMPSKDGNRIEFYNRYTGKAEEEKVYGGDAVRFFYGNSFGQKLEALISLPFVSVLYGWTQNLRVSRHKVPKFIKNFSIDMEQYQAGSLGHEKKELTYKSFNEFFIREFYSGEREFVKQGKLPAVAEGRYLGYESVTEDITFPVKGKFLRSKDLLAANKWAKDFEAGPMLIARLCPVDYHRYHYPCNGHTLDFYRVGGALHSVNPMALRFRPSLFLENVRRVSILQTECFGKLAYIEVGATCVGRIVQSHDEMKEFKRGDEKGYFLFGGSTVILIGEKGAWKPAQDIIENTAQNREVYIRLGDQIGSI